MDTVKIWMGEEDLAVVQKIFDRTQEPNFTIVHTYRLEGTTCVQVEFAVDSSMSLWYLAKLVEMDQHFEREYKKSLEKIKQLVEETRKKVFGNE